MPPVTLKLNAYVYNYLYTIQMQAQATAKDYKGKEDYFANLGLLTIAELKLKDPIGLLFPKKGKAVRITFSQAVALHTAIWQYTNQNIEKVNSLFELFMLLDRALTDYSPIYGYKG